MAEARPVALAIVGATATGKTAVSERLATLLDAEIVCADSRQVFRELDIGTGKPSPAERADRPHHLYDALGVGDRASAGWYADAAAAACADVRGRGRLPLLVGGSGLYLRALTRGLADAPPHDPAVRERLDALLASDGVEAMHRRLHAVDPATAGRLAPRDAQRIMRALEVWEGSGRPLSWWHARGDRPRLEGAVTIVQLAVEPAALRQRIEARTRAMFAGGIVEETAALLGRGLRDALVRLRAIGYDEALGLLEGHLGRADAEARVSLRTVRLAKRQRTWFRHQVRAASLDAGEVGASDLARRIAERLRES